MLYCLRIFITEFNKDVYEMKTRFIRLDNSKYIKAIFIHLITESGKISNLCDKGLHWSFT